MKRSFPLMRRLVLAAAVVLTALLVLAASALAANVRLGDSGFEPSELTVPAGETVVWTNGTERTQTIVGTDGSWDSGPLAPGETFSVQLRQAGTIGFRTQDGAHEGLVRVASSAQSAAPIDPTEPALPRTGLPLLALVALAVGLVGGGAVMVLRAQRA